MTPVARSPNRLPHDRFWHQFTARQPGFGRGRQSCAARGEGNSFYEGSARVKSPAAGFLPTWRFSFALLRVLFALVGPVRLTMRARCARHHRLSVSAFWPSTRCGMRAKRARRTGLRTRRPIDQDGPAQGTAQEFHGRLDQPSTRQAPVVDERAGSDRRGDEPRALGDHAVLEVAPQRDQ